MPNADAAIASSDKVFVAGDRGMVGSAIVRALTDRGYDNLLTAARDELDLLDTAAVNTFFATHRPDQVYLAAARVGGIVANNTEPADFIADNLVIQTNVIKAAHDHGVQRLLFLGSSCIYPKFAEQPIREDSLLTGVLEPTNEPYAVAKIAGIKLCESFNRQFSRDYRSVMPTNLYGPGDNYHPQHSHVIPAMLRRFHEAAAAGQMVLSQEILGLIEGDSSYVAVSLGPREREVLALYTSGLEVPEVASLLGIAENSVKEYLKRIRVKYTNVDRPAANKLDLFRRAIEDGIVPPVEPKL